MCSSGLLSVLIETLLQAARPREKGAPRPIGNSRQTQTPSLRVFWFNKESKMTQEQIAKFFKCTPEQLAAQHARNAADLTKMGDKAAKTGKKVNGYTAAQLAAMADKSAKLAAK